MNDSHDFGALLTSVQLCLDRHPHLRTDEVMRQVHRLEAALMIELPSPDQRRRSQEQTPVGRGADLLPFPSKMAEHR
jgi:hypothetical protein